MRGATILGPLSACLLGSFLTPSAKASEADRMTDVKFDGPVRIENTVLLPGKYVFEIQESPSDLDIVRVMTGDGERLVTTVFGMPAFRQNPDHSQITFYKNTAAGETPALKNWFYGGDQDGVEFSLTGHAPAAGGMK